MARIGRMRHRVTIQSVATTKGATGAPTVTTTDVATVWADVRGLSGSEQLEQPLEQVGSATQCRVTMRYRGDLRPTMRLVWHCERPKRERVLQVRSIIEPDNRLRIVQLDCTEEL